jgi:RNA polymerase sigma factor (sigma-70 family)
MRTVALRKTDGELLAAYSRQGSAEAFDELVRRHAPKVFAAALRVLGDRHAAEDVSQATFLLLARKARALTGHAAVSGWLFRTAGFIAARGARKRKHRKAWEEAAVKLRKPGEGDSAWRELAPELDAAVAELPTGYRDAVILRHVDGLSQSETAHELGISESAVSMRVSRGLDKLREKLGSRGAVVSAGLLALLLGERAGKAGEISELVSSIQAVCRAAVEPSGSVLAMMEEAMRAMRMKKLKPMIAAAAVLLCAALIAPFGVSAWAGGDGAAKPEAVSPAPEPTPVPIAAAAAPRAKPTAALKKVVATEKQKLEIVRKANAFAFDLYAKVRADKQQKGTNIFFSPFSISSALAMTYAGAAGNTAAEMRKVMHFDLKEQELHPAFGDLTAALNKRGKAGSFKLAVANRLWGQQDYHFLQNFLEMNKLYYGAGVERVNFKRDPDGSRKIINAWVEKKTEDKIKELLLKPDITTDVRLVLTNAIYFKGDWARQFEEKRTHDRKFTVSAKKQVKIPMMNQTAKFPYMRGDGFQALELPYKGEELAMVVLLPDRKSSLAVLEKKLDPKVLGSAMKKLREQKVIVAFPKFKMEWRLDLKKTLVEMGMVDAFGGAADFSGMTGTRDLYISKVIHKAFVAVDEKGTEAAAATAVVMGQNSIPRHPYFIADRPFVFLIRDRKTGSILFLGRVINPKG